MVVEAALEGWGQRRIAVAMPVRIVHRPPHPPRPGQSVWEVILHSISPFLEATFLDAHTSHTPLASRDRLTHPPAAHAQQAPAFGAAPSSPRPTRSDARASVSGRDKSRASGGSEADEPATPTPTQADGLGDDLSSVSLSPGPGSSTFPRVRSESAMPLPSAPDAVENLPAWMPDEEVSACCVCRRKFTLFLRRHHCRMCGRIVCAYCGPIRGPRNVRICPTCNGTVS